MKYIVLVNQPMTRCQPKSNAYMGDNGSLVISEKQATRFDTQDNAKLAFVRFITLHPKTQATSIVATVKQ